MKKEKHIEKTNVISNFLKILKYIDKTDIKIILMWNFLMLLISIIPTFSVFLNKILVDNFTLLYNEKAKRALVLCVFICISICVSEVIIELLKNICYVLYNKINYKTTHKLEKNFYYVISNLPMEYFDDYRLHKDIILAQDGLATNGIEIIDKLNEIISRIISIFSIFIILYVVSWRLPVVIIIGTVPSLIAVILCKKLKYKKHKDLVEQRKKRDYIISLFLSRKAVKELKIFRAFSYLIKIWDEKDKSIQEEDVKLLSYQNKINIYAVTISKIFTALSMIWMIFMIRDSKITLGSYLSIVSAIGILTSSLGSIFSSIADLYENNKYLNALFKIFNIWDCIEYDTINNDEKIDDIQNIKFCNVSFSYPSTSYDVIKNVDFEINKGDKVAIIGHNGSGKTTLINLMMGLYKNYTGEILINGSQLKNYKSYYSKLASVFQDFSRYELTLRENVAIGNIDNIDNDNLIRAVLNEINLDRVNECDLDIMLSPFYKNGIDLSGGEWQKVALARAIFRKAEIFFFDEPTAALDPDAEIEFYNNLLKVINDKTFIIVTHRLAITNLCNKIIVVDNGEVIENGTHDELISKGGVYYNMYKKQRGAYGRKNFSYDFK